MMKYTPRVRSEIAPIARANNPAMITASGQVIQALATPSTVRMPTVYAPAPRNAAWPKLTMPPLPRMRFRLEAAIA